MGDRELLEYAAKAAGIEIDKSETNGGGRGNTGFNLRGDVVLDWHNGDTWNPLKDDGDALRLAFALKLTMAFRGNCFGVWNTNSPMVCSDICQEGDISDFRRRIVRAAAEIGKAMP